MSAPGQRSKTVGRRMMADGATDRHNVLAPEAVKMIVTGTNYEVTEAMTVLESIVHGVIGFHVLRFKPGGDRLRTGREKLDLLTSRVLDRLGSLSLPYPNQGGFQHLP